MPLVTLKFPGVTVRKECHLSRSELSRRVATLKVEFPGIGSACTSELAARRHCVEGTVDSDSESYDILHTRASMPAIRAAIKMHFGSAGSSYSVREKYGMRPHAERAS